jgi:adenylate cyclase
LLLLLLLLLFSLSFASHHPSMLGYIRQSSPHRIVFEYMPLGNLRDYLRDVRMR